MGANGSAHLHHLYGLSRPQEAGSPVKRGSGFFVPARRARGVLHDPMAGPCSVLEPVRHPHQKDLQ